MVAHESRSAMESFESVETKGGSPSCKKGLVRSCVANPPREPLTEDTLLKLEQSQPHYRLAQRNLDHWFFYLESTFQDVFDTHIDRTDPDFYPSCFEQPGSVVSLSQADFQETHHSLASSIDLFGLTARSPPPDVQVIISQPVSAPPPTPLKVKRSSSPEWEGFSSSPDNTQPADPVPEPTSPLAPHSSSTTGPSPQFRPRRSSNRLPKKRSYVVLSSDTEYSNG
jgi:hypothetical protein